ncbi:MAG: N-acetylmuramoyl-L-alanine amidase [Firmicutes bacterium]|uniref:N-acetylmuramoyl-L-alanine amidase n=1 Tax=Candidatus Scybalomonas excrementavium TaxID=2840943 RepID=A0A9D9I0R1_9FIRM|nr:N-acetylmuramoyl-L-alanine amidase [Candidatus Scybalomonas excrementavium]
MKSYIKYVTVFVLSFVWFLNQTQFVQAAVLSITYNGQTYKYEGKQLSVKCGDEIFNLKKCPGILENGYGLLPYNVFQHQSLGVSTTYNKTKKTITFAYKQQKVVVTLNSNKMKVNGKTQTLPVVPRSVRYNDTKVTKLLVPSRSIAEALGLQYSYNSAKALISMSQKAGSNESVSTDTKKEGISITYNGKTYQYTGKQLSAKCGDEIFNLKKCPGILENGYGLLPYNVFQHKALGVTATYDKTKKTATFQYGKNTVVVTLNSKTMLVNKKKVTLPVEPKQVKYNDTKVTKVLVPSRSVAENLGLQYEYDSKTATISIASDKKVDADSEETEDKNTGSSNTENTNTGSTNTSGSTNNQTGREIEYNGKVVVITKKDVTVKTQGVTIQSAMPGIILNNTAMLPAYNTFHKNTQLGTTYTYDSNSKTATLTGNGNTLVLTMGSKTGKLNGKSIALSEPAWMIKNKANNKTYCMVPGQSVAQALGFTYTWTNSTVTSSIDKKSQDVPDNNNNSNNNSNNNNSNEQNPSTDTEDKDSNKIESGDFESYEVMIPRPSGVAWKQCQVEDDYFNYRFVITLPGDYTSFYNKNQIQYNNIDIDSVTISKNSQGKTQIIIETPVVQGMAYNETKSEWKLAMKSPSEIYDQIVVVDAGHGGSDSGSLSKEYGVIEKNTVLDIIKRTQKYFNQDEKIKVYYTRLTDAQSGITYGGNVSSTTVSVINRANFANEIGADLFISVHCNSATNTSARGTEVLYSSKNTAVNESGLTSKKFADLAFPHLLGAVGSTKRDVKDSPNLIVCKNTKMPAILLEVAFLSNEADATLLKDTDVLDNVAKSIYDMTKEAFSSYPTH